MSASVETVRGPVAAAELGRTSVHEHLLIDLECWFDAPTDAASTELADQHVCGENELAVRANPFAVHDNLHLDDLDLAAAELGRFRDAGGVTVVDLTLDDIGRDALRLRDISRRSGVNIVMGCGHYIARAHPAGLAERSVSQLAAEMLADLCDGRDGVRAGVIGEIGTSDPIDPVERRVLSAACWVQRETGRALFVHLDPWGHTGHEVLDLCESAGVPLDRVALCHLDPTLPDLAYHRSLALRGAWIGYDIWGDEDAYGGRGMPTDMQRAAAVRAAHDQGWSGRLVLAQDVCLKTQLHAHGGRGYDHLLRGVPERLREAGLTDADIETILVDHPRRLLAGE